MKMNDQPVGDLPTPRCGDSGKFIAKYLETGTGSRFPRDAVRVGVLSGRWDLPSDASGSYSVASRLKTGWGRVSQTTGTGFDGVPTVRHEIILNPSVEESDRSQRIGPVRERYFWLSAVSNPCDPPIGALRHPLSLIKAAAASQFPSRCEAEALKCSCQITRKPCRASSLFAIVSKIVEGATSGSAVDWKALGGERRLRHGAAC